MCVDYINIIDYPKSVDRQRLIPKIGSSYETIEELEEVVGLLYKWQFKKAMHRLDECLLSEIACTDALLLKAEIFAIFEENQQALDIYHAIHNLDDENIYALIGLLTQLVGLNGPEELIHSKLDLLSELSKSAHNQFIQIVELIERYKNKFDMYCKSDEIDLICLFGYFLNENGTFPAKLLRRLQKTYDIYQKNPNATILISGGAVQNAYIEAFEMKKYLIKTGIPDDKVVVLDRARDTVGNILEFLNYIQSDIYPKICAVTSRDHLPRAWMSLLIGLSKSNYATILYGDSPEESITQQMIVKEHQLNYQTLFRIAGLFEKKDIDLLVTKDSEDV